jgi:hypothetical protein
MLALEQRFEPLAELALEQGGKLLEQSFKLGQPLQALGMFGFQAAVGGLGLDLFEPVG